MENSDKTDCPCTSSSAGPSSGSRGSSSSAGPSSGSSGCTGPISSNACSATCATAYVYSGTCATAYVYSGTCATAYSATCATAYSATCATAYMSVPLNTEQVPSRFTRYRHPSHKHRLFMLKGLANHCCDNTSCNKSISQRDTIFRCFRCDFDLCERCFQLGSTKCVPLSPRDADVDETTIRPLNFLVETD